MKTAITTQETKAWEKLREVLKTGDIIHVAERGEEFLTDYEDFYLYIGKGMDSDWEGKEGVEIDVDGNYPNEVGGYNQGKIFSQKATEVLNPLDETEGWEKDFEFQDAGENGFFLYKPAYR